MKIGIVGLGLIEQLDIFTKNLQEYIDVMKNGDSNALRELLKEGRELKSSAGGN